MPTASVRMFASRRILSPKGVWYPGPTGIRAAATMAKVARVGRREEIDLAEEARSWPGIWVGEKLPRNGDFLMALSDSTGNGVVSSHAFLF